MEISTLILTIFTAGVCFYYFFLRKLSHFERQKIPHVRPIPLLGNMTAYVFGGASMMGNLCNIYNLFPDAKYFGFYEFMRPIYVIRDVDLINTIAIKNFDNFCDHRNFTNEEIEPMASKNLFGLRGDHWREMRKLLSPSFTSSKMKMMFGLICQCAENSANFLAAESGSTGKTYDMKDVLSRFANDVIATSAFGISVDSFKHPKNEFFLLGKSLNFGPWMSFVFLMHRSFPKISKLINLRMFGPKVDKFFKDVVTSTVKARDEQGIVRPDLIQLMMETRDKNDGPAFDIDEMTAQAFVFFLGGFDTVSTIMSFAAHEIAVNPDVQNKLRKEIDDVLKETNGKPPTYEIINNMKYLDAIINETLRLYPPGFFLDRLCVKEYELPSATPDSEPVTLKPGDSIWFPVFALHRDSKYYSQPEKFDPDRFLNDEVDNSVYMPFGIGPRICIGNRFALMEAKIMLFYLLWYCDVEPDIKTSNPMVLHKKTFVVTAANKFWLKLRTRKLSVPIE